MLGRHRGNSGSPTVLDKQIEELTEQVRTGVGSLLLLPAVLDCRAAAHRHLVSSGLLCLSPAADGVQAGQRRTGEGKRLLLWETEGHRDAVPAV